MKLRSIIAAAVAVLSVDASVSLDPHSVANFSAFKTTHIDLDWHVDFEQSLIEADATLSIERIAQKVDRVILDCSALNIIAVSDADTKEPLEFEYNPEATKFGGSLEITVPEKDFLNIRIKYKTTAGSGALQWLKPEQTLGKQHPYLFSQCEAIFARTIVPCQDTPSIRATYSARVTVPAPLVAVMSANIREQVPCSGPFNSYIFKQTTPIPSYLIAIGVGDIRSKEIGPRSAIWSEAANLEAAAEEFSDTERFISTAESLVGPYVWGRYDILLLPPSFPYGGMENPCLTFLTPSLLTGDKSLVDVVAHEISHSWTGNLVSCKNWEHFWLNEGLTMFLQRKILGRIHGEPYRQFDSLLGLADLKEDVERLKYGPLTKLVPDLSDINPDDAFSRVSYEKGYLLLYTLEEIVGIPKFEKFFRAYIKHFANQSIDTAQFKAFLLEFFKNDAVAHPKLIGFSWDEWLTGNGIAPFIPDYSNELVIPCRRLSEAWINTGASGDVQFSSLKSGQKILFFSLLLSSSKGISPEIVTKMASEYSMSSCTNSKVLLKWYQLCIHTRAEEFYLSAAQYASERGCVKYNRPIYRGLYQSGPTGKRIALDTFARSRDTYHPIAVQMISKDLEL